MYMTEMMTGVIYMAANVHATYVLSVYIRMYVHTYSSNMMVYSVPFMLQILYTYV